MSPVDATAGAVRVFGVALVGVTPQNAEKLLLSIGFVVGVMLLSKGLRWAATLAERGRKSGRVVFWTRQGIALITALVLICGVLSIWFNNTSGLTSVLGLFSAGLAVALQRVITAVAGYFVILRGRTFSVGDRITMAGVRGDVIALGFVQTTIMEMGQPPAVQSDAPAMWVRARQYSGRIVTITNDKIFDNPVYNYSREFPLIWDEMSIPVPYRSDRKRAEAILLKVARQHTLELAGFGEEKLRELERQYFVRTTEMEPKVYYRLTDNWVELTVRFITHEFGTRALKDRMSRDILDAFEEAGIEIASGTYDIVGLPPLTVRLEPETAAQAAGSAIRPPRSPQSARP